MLRALVLIAALASSLAHGAPVKIIAVTKRALKPVEIGFSFQIVQPPEFTFRSAFPEPVFEQLEKKVLELQKVMPEAEVGDPDIFLLPGYEYVGVTGKHPYYFRPNDQIVRLEIPVASPNPIDPAKLKDFVIEQINAIRLYKRLEKALREKNIELNNQLPLTLVNPLLEKLIEIVKDLQFIHLVEIVMIDDNMPHVEPEFDNQPGLGFHWSLFAEYNHSEPSNSFPHLARELQEIGSCDGELRSFIRRF